MHDSIAWEAPCAKDGGIEKRASPTKKIFLLSEISNFLLIYIGKDFIFFSLPSNSIEVFFKI